MPSGRRGPPESGPEDTHPGTHPKVNLPGARARRSYRPSNAGEEWVPSRERHSRAPSDSSSRAESAVQNRSDRPDRGEARREDRSRRGRREREEGRNPSGRRHESFRRQQGESASVVEGDTHRAESEEKRVAEIKAAHAAWDSASYVVEPMEGKTRFAELDIASEVLHAIADLGFQYCTPIQAGILPDLLKGSDGLGKAQTGTGKTCAFLTALYTRLLRTPPSGPPGTPRAVILAPTRELALQIDKEAALIGKYTPFRSVAVFGGVDYQKQRAILRERRAEIIVATPGRLIDYLRSNSVDLSHVEVLVIDEADRMLDMGFIPDVRQIVRRTPHPERRQTFFFSATFTGDVRRLAEQWTRDAVKVEIEPEHVAAETVDQAVYIAAEEEKVAIILNLLHNEMPERILIFVNRRDTAERLCRELTSYNVRAEILSGAIPQDKRMRRLELFREGRLRVLVATDVAGRGLHVEGISHVINYNLPDDPEDYVHRIGRTGRAGADGKSISFASPLDAQAIPDIEKFIGRELPCTHPADEWLVMPPKPEPSPEQIERQARRAEHHGRERPNHRSRGGHRRGRPSPRPVHERDREGAPMRETPMESPSEPPVRPEET